MGGEGAKGLNTREKERSEDAADLQGRAEAGVSDSFGHPQSWPGHPDVRNVHVKEEIVAGVLVESGRDRLAQHRDDGIRPGTANGIVEGAAGSVQNVK